MEDPEDPVPVFGTWPRIYTAALLLLLAVMVSIAVFSLWPW